MNCDAVHSGDLVERYALGELSDAERSSFEDHFFACDSCFEAVRLMQSLQAVADERPRTSLPGLQAVAPRRTRKWTMWGAAAAVVIAGFGLAEMGRRAPRTEVRTAQTNPAAAITVPGPSPELQLLARVDAPRYTAPNLRSAAPARDTQFRAAMAKYAAGEYAVAAEALRGLANGGPETAAARFYLGICEMMTGDANDAAEHLRATASLGETPYLEEARFFLAKALLAKQDTAGATQALEQTIALTGDRETEARRLLEQLRHAAPAR